MKKPDHKICFALVGAIFFAGNLFIAAASTPDAAGLEFFESKIRPLFIDNCYKCHSAESESIKGGLLLDSKEGVLNGGDSGPSIVPGDPEASLLIKAIRYTDENLQMPPKDKKLSPEQIADLETWVKMGAPDSRVQGLTFEVQSSTSAKDHWAFQPIRNSPVPTVKNKSWAKTSIDNFISAKLEEKNLKPSPQADKRTLIRRASFDLTGLPPTLDEVESFLKDKSLDAFAKVVDRLLASPRYGERWGRHWLDVARYADTKGYLAGNQERRFPYSYTYRDYVIDAFNKDLPYDEFLVQQIAADQLELGENKRPLAALGFLTLGRRFLNNQHDIIDDRIDVVTRGTMALTVACSRCHDHKYDPIPIKDYYSLYGVFASSEEPNEQPLLGIAPPEKAHAEYLAEKSKREEAAKSFRENKTAEIVAQLRQRSGEYMLAALDTQRLENKSTSEALARERKLDPGVVERWMSSLATWSSQTNPIFAPWFEFAALSESEFIEKAGDITTKLASNDFLNLLVKKSFSETPASMKEVSERYGKLFAETEKLWSESLANQAKGSNALAFTALSDVNQESLRQILYAPDAPVNLSDYDKFFDVASIERLRELRRQVAELDATHPGAPARAMALVDKATPENAHVFIRGNAGSRGPEVPRQFLGIIAGEERKPFEKGSGRLEMAQAIVSRENPLTARVIVNRVWLYHFGEGLVATPSDFGVRSDPPSHPELLDYLAWNFMENGWSLKKLHRQIMLSSVYQQSSDENPRSAKIDPENKLLWKMDRQRLDLEALRDSLLMVSGKLDLTTGGRPVDIVSESSTRRTVYGYIDRQNLPGLFRTFDFANPDTSSPQRFFTTVPQQALFLLNSPFVVEQAKGLIASERFDNFSSDAERIQFLYNRIYQRAPAKEEFKFSEKFIRLQSTLPTNSTMTTDWKYGFGEFNETKSKTKFIPFTRFLNNQWQPAKNFPNPKFGHAMLNSEGGHPGNIQAHSVIRRWTSPFEGVVKIEGTLLHPSDKGDGVLGRIVSSRHGELGNWVAQNGNAETGAAECKVKRGDTIDFITELRKGAEYDSFKWLKTIKVGKVEYGTSPPKKSEWNSVGDYDGPSKEPQSLNPWEKYAQVLLLSNEFMFVD